MFVEKLSLVAFRNLKNETLTFSPGVNLFLGDNGQGKSNILESLHLLFHDKSFRPSVTNNFIHRDFNQASVRSILHQRKLKYFFELQISAHRKKLQVNEKPMSFSKLAPGFSTILFSPESLSVIKDSSEQRRDLLDELLITLDANHRKILEQFSKTLRTRNKVLKDFAESNAASKQLLDILHSLHPSYMDISTELTTARLKAIETIREDFRKSMNAISKIEKDVRIEYFISDQVVNDMSHQESRFLLEKRAKELHSAELARGSSLVGPHKHDVKFLYDGNDSRFFSSQGQQRALILSFKMAQIVYHRRAYQEAPLLLLDDVLSELDPNKREALLAFLNEVDSQIFMTTTDLNFSKPWTKAPMKIMHVCNGKVNEEYEERG